MDHSAGVSKQQTERIWMLDILRIAATWGIVLLHASALPASCGVDTPAWKMMAAISCLFRWCVPVFLMISGALFLDNRKRLSTAQLYRRPILRIGISFVCWSVFYAGVHCIIMGKGKWTFLNQLLRGHYHMWYIFVIAGLYMLTPLLRKMTESRKMTEYFLVLGLLFVFVLPRLIAFVQLFALPHADVVDSLRSAIAQVNPLPGAANLYYYVLGYYLCAYAPGRASRRLLVLAGAAGYLLTAALTIWHSVLTGEVSGRFYEPGSLTVLLMTAGVFAVFQYAFRQFSPGERMKRLLATLSKCSFGVYLVHPFFVERMQLSLPPSAFLLIVGIPALTTLFYLLSLAVSFVLNRIPVLNRYIV